MTAKKSTTRPESGKTGKASKAAAAPDSAAAQNLASEILRVSKSSEPLQKKTAQQILPTRHDSFSGTQVLRPLGKPSKKVKKILDLIEQAARTR